VVRHRPRAALRRRPAAHRLRSIAILWGLKHIESLLPREHHGNLCLTLDATAPSEADLRRHILAAGCDFTRWNPTYNPPSTLSSLDCTLHWRERAFRSPHTPVAIDQLRALPGIRSLTWQE
jgi:hypothetical protein